MMTLKELFANLPIVSMTKELTEVTGISYSTKNLKPGDIFVCLKGEHVDGHDFIDEALRLKASAIVAAHKKYIPKRAAGVVVKDTRNILAEISAKFYKFPTNNLKLIGITGTNGKTTSSTVVYDILVAAGIKSGLIGTMNYRIGGETFKSIHTTPQAVELQEMLYNMTLCDTDTAVMEVSSHAISLDRVVGCKYDIVCFTNLTQDHLDFHKNMEGYMSTKLKLFTDNTLHKNDAVAVINYDDPHSDIFYESFSGKKYTYGINGGTFTAKDVKMKLSGSTFTLIYPQGEEKIKLNLVGQFNISNALLAITVCYLCGVEIKQIAKILSKIMPVDGRFEQVKCDDNKGKPAVIVDYAHTPDGLEKILETANQIAPGNVHLVFGCGGDRDKTKRPKMAAIAAKYAKKIIVTSDNPRSEDPCTIIEEICTGFTENDLKKVTKIIDRKEAIFNAITGAKAKDIVILAGKGHEDYQIFADKTIHFDDREVAKEALNNYKI